MSQNWESLQSRASYKITKGKLQHTAGHKAAKIRTM